MENRINDTTKFILAGKAIFTIQNSKTGKRFTYKVTKAKNADREMWFVAAFKGTDNSKWYNYKYMGLIQDDRFKSTQGSLIREDEIAWIAFDWFWRNMGKHPDTLGVYHEGRCARCGRRLTVPESIKAGFGPECVQFI